ncbi:hypothetical protein [Cyanobacterium sp. Dongsha4]|uniref:hypothetical protein n=1 Tax=Cyanobacterium sp. DS4 TaxID=2878255 RepID=UPI002E81BF38|nr:hypothetical protein [Cyanobacterium sp. Dongsha4]WVK99144.1 hypothetical protein Dongsha4_10585 [Cyanobacterium sp. Dongsha4]
MQTRPSNPLIFSLFISDSFEKFEPQTSSEIPLTGITNNEDYSILFLEKLIKKVELTKNIKNLYIIAERLWTISQGKNEIAYNSLRASTK